MIVWFVKTAKSQRQMAKLGNKCVCVIQPMHIKCTMSYDCRHTNSHLMYAKVAFVPPARLRPSIRRSQTFSSLPACCCCPSLLVRAKWFSLWMWKWYSDRIFPIGPPLPHSKHSQMISLGVCPRVLSASSLGGSGWLCWRPFVHLVELESLPAAFVEVVWGLSCFIHSCALVVLVANKGIISPEDG